MHYAKQKKASWPVAFSSFYRKSGFLTTASCTEACQA